MAMRCFSCDAIKVRQSHACARGRYSSPDRLLTRIRVRSWHGLLEGLAHASDVHRIEALSLLSRQGSPFMLPTGEDLDAFPTIRHVRSIAIDLLTRDDASLRNRILDAGERESSVRADILRASER